MPSPDPRLRYDELHRAGPRGSWRPLVGVVGLVVSFLVVQQVLAALLAIVRVAGGASYDDVLAELDGDHLRFVASSTIPTTGIKGTDANIQGIFHALIRFFGAHGQILAAQHDLNGLPAFFYRDGNLCLCFVREKLVQLRKPLFRIFDKARFERNATAGTCNFHRTTSLCFGCPAPLPESPLPTWFHFRQLLPVPLL